MSLCQYICSDIGEHVINIQSIIIIQMVIAVIKAFSVPITAKRQIRVDSFTLSCSLVFILLPQQ